ncbi:hypothetical protein AAVH_27466 [Aphelenchoides avenae]|nr:hypothetical protein AAVH_27466 [Aphelenchus avenae]
MVTVNIQLTQGGGMGGGRRKMVTVNIQLTQGGGMGGGLQQRLRPIRARNYPFGNLGGTRGVYQKDQPLFGIWVKY